MDSGTCTSCGAEVVWIRAISSGKIQICEMTRKVGYTADGELKRIHESHFAYCPNASQHRK